MYLELIKTDFLTLDGSLTSFTLTPLKKPNGTNKVRADRTVDFKNTNENSNISHSKNMSILADFNKIIELNPSFWGVSLNINNLIDFLLTKWKSDRLKRAKREQRK
ncbi:hypothetical protein [Hazenella coriacea]|uniref:Uncharacterized protein n=1 Tax=Hazenella coriacea TaxID=1179467 RepID=A0A4R3LDZ9_9BACL|nr:hypothetical protein [Hazenella coriacea]TCS96554.1 hypothetical protein EDD58_101188 [Hazenella coriacea]